MKNKKNILIVLIICLPLLKSQSINDIDRGINYRSTQKIPGHNRIPKNGKLQIRLSKLIHFIRTNITKWLQHIIQLQFKRFQNAEYGNTQHYLRDSPQNITQNNLRNFSSYNSTINQTSNIYDTLHIPSMADIFNSITSTTIIENYYHKVQNAVYHQMNEHSSYFFSSPSSSSTTKLSPLQKAATSKLSQVKHTHKIKNKCKYCKHNSNHHYHRHKPVHHYTTFNIDTIKQLISNDGVTDVDNTLDDSSNNEDNDRNTNISSDEDIYVNDTELLDDNYNDSYGYTGDYIEQEENNTDNKYDNYDYNDINISNDNILSFDDKNSMYQYFSSDSTLVTTPTTTPSSSSSSSSSPTAEYMSHLLDIPYYFYHTNPATTNPRPQTTPQTTPLQQPSTTKTKYAQSSIIIPNKYVNRDNSNNQNAGFFSINNYYDMHLFHTVEKESDSDNHYIDASILARDSTMTYDSDSSSSSSSKPSPPKKSSSSSSSTVSNKKGDSTKHPSLRSKSSSSTTSTTTTTTSSSTFQQDATSSSSTITSESDTSFSMSHILLVTFYNLINHILHGILDTIYTYSNIPMTSLGSTVLLFMIILMVITLTLKHQYDMEIMNEYIQQHASHTKKLNTTSNTINQPPSTHTENSKSNETSNLSVTDNVTDTITTMLLQPLPSDPSEIDIKSDVRTESCSNSSVNSGDNSCHESISKDVTESTTAMLPVIQDTNNSIKPIFTHDKDNNTSIHDSSSTIQAQDSSIIESITSSPILINSTPNNPSIVPIIPISSNQESSPPTLIEAKTQNQKYSYNSNSNSNSNSIPSTIITAATSTTMNNTVVGMSDDQNKVENYLVYMKQRTSTSHYWISFVHKKGHLLVLLLVFLWIYYIAIEYIIRTQTSHRIAMTAINNFILYSDYNIHPLLHHSPHHTHHAFIDPWYPFKSLSVFKNVDTSILTTIEKQRQMPSSNSDSSSSSSSSSSSKEENRVLESRKETLNLEWVNTWIQSLWIIQSIHHGLGPYISATLEEVLNEELKLVPSGVANIGIQQCTLGLDPPVIRGISAEYRIKSSPAVCQEIYNTSTSNARQRFADYMRNLSLSNTDNNSNNSGSSSSSSSGGNNVFTSTSALFASLASSIMSKIHKYDRYHTQSRDPHRYKYRQRKQAQTNKLSYILSNIQHYVYESGKIILKSIRQWYLSTNIKNHTLYNNIHGNTDMRSTLSSASHPTTSTITDTSNKEQQYTTSTSTTSSTTNTNILTNDLLNEGLRGCEYIILDIDLAYVSEDMSMALSVTSNQYPYLANTVTVSLDKINFSGKLRMNIDLIAEYPFLGNTTYQFLELPILDMTISGFGGVDVSSLPGVYELIHTAMMWLLSQFTAPYESSIDLKYCICPSCVESPSTPSIKPYPIRLMESIQRIVNKTITASKEICAIVNETTILWNHLRHSIQHIVHDLQQGYSEAQNSTWDKSILLL